MSNDQVNIDPITAIPTSCEVHGMTGTTLSSEHEKFCSIIVHFSDEFLQILRTNLLNCHEETGLLQAL